MAYFTGTAISCPDLLSKFQTHLTTDLPPADQYTLEGDVLYKDGLYVLVEGFDTPTNFMNIIGGTGSDGGGNLTGQPPFTGTPAQNQIRDCAFYPVRQPTDFTFPLTYFVHVFTNPDEVYLIAQDAGGSRFTHLSFGRSPAPNLPGTGNWYHATYPNAWVNFDADTRYTENFSVQGARANILFSSTQQSGTSGNTAQPGCTFLQHGLDGNQWSNVGNDVGSNNQTTTVTWNSTESVATCAELITPLDKIPNVYNEQAILLRMSPMVLRPAGASSIVANLEHIRFTRLDNYEALDIITIGLDQWRLYPPIKRNIVDREGGLGVDHSGTFGYAIRYDGP